MKSSLTFAHFCFLCLIFISSCQQEKVKKVHPPEFNKEHARYVSAFTSGSLDRCSPLRVRFAQDVVPATMVGKEAEKLFDFNPAVNGHTQWRDRRTVEFVPEAYFIPGKVYDVTLDLKIVYDTVPAAYRQFPFQFHIPHQQAEIQVDALLPVKNEKHAWYRLHGKVATSQFEYAAIVERSLNILKEGREIKPRWSHDSIGKEHYFYIDSLERKANAYSLELKWKSTGAGGYSQNKTVDIPSLHDFKVMDAKATSDPEQYITLQFSDPLQESQDLLGLIHSNNNSFNFIIERNKVKAYPSARLTGEVMIIVEPGLRNALGYTSGERDSVKVNFEEILPQVRSVENGVIVPRSGGIPFYFEAVNVKAVDVRITKIYQSNILEFLQFNDLDGYRYLEYVGKTVYEGKIMLAQTPSVDHGRWNRHAMDLTKLIQTDPGAMYRVEIRTRKEYALCDCPYDEKKTSIPGLPEKAGQKLWDYYDDYYYYYDSGEDPCKDSYYRSMDGVARNVLASDLGMIVKTGAGGNYLVAVSDLGTAEPLKGVDVNFYDRQNQGMGYGKTDERGLLTVSFKEKPWVAVAKYGRQRGYLKMSQELDMNRFDVSGNTYWKGLNGFIYTERGVWRPGDSLFVTFLMEDKQHVLPEGHPVHFELYNPSGQLVEQAVRYKGLNGCYVFGVDTDENAPTGTYVAKVKVGGTAFEKRLKIETIIPNRLKIDLNLSGNRLSPDTVKAGDLLVRWLHGAPCARLKADVNASFRKAAEPFPSFSDYTFDDPFYVTPPASERIFEGQLDEEGKAEIMNRLKIKEGVSGVLHTDFYCKVFEPGGNFSTAYRSSMYYPYKEYAGIQRPAGNSGSPGTSLDRGQTHIFRFVGVNESGEPVSPEMTVRLYRLRYNWWWEYDENFSSYNGRELKIPVREEKIMLKNGRAEWKFQPEEGEEGCYLVRASLPSGHSTGTVFNVVHPYWYNVQENKLEGTALLTLSSSKKKYVVGEKAIIEVPGGFKGKALVTLEKGGKVLKADWVSSSEGKVRYTFEVSREMSPTVYACVTMLQPHAQTTNDLPMRMYGLLPLEVEDPRRHLYPEISMAEVMRPEEKTVISVREKNGKRMTYTLALVDEGLLDLTGFRTPDPWMHFNGKEAHQVTTWDLYDEVIKRHSWRVKKILTIGGDDAVRAGQAVKLQRFKPVVKFLGPFFLEPGKTACHSVQIPNYMGSVRAMVVAGHQGSYGAIERTANVRKPLMVLATLPRVLSPDEEIMMPVTVFAEENVKKVTLEVTVNDLLRPLENMTMEVVFDKPGEQLVNFPLKVASATGIARVSVRAISGKEKAWHETILNVRAPNPCMTKNLEGLLNMKEGKVYDYSAFGIEGTNEGTLEFSSMPPIHLEQRLSYLIRYPHGCIEQTTSSVFPQLAFMRLIHLKGRQKNEIGENIKAGIKRLGLFRIPDGGLSYWPGEGTVSEWGTNYAGHFLINAASEGFDVPSGLMNSWKQFQRQMASRWSSEGDPHSDQIQAYRLYLLAKAKSPEFGAMNRMKESKNISVIARWCLAGAYYLAGQPSAATAMSKGLPLHIDPYHALGYTYGSSMRDEAMILEILSVMNRHEEGKSLFSEICSRLRSDKWMSTQETAYCLIAVAAFTGNASAGLAFRYKLPGSGWVSFKSDKQQVQIPLDLSLAPHGKIEILNEGTSILHTNVCLKGIPVAGDEKPFSGKVSMEVKYFNRMNEPVDVSEIGQGTDIIAEIKVSSASEQERLDEMALSFLIPSGWEIHNPRLNGDQFSLRSSVPQYMDIRDDRVNYYFDMYRQDYANRKMDYESSGGQSGGNVQIYRMALNATYLGKFYLPAVYVEAMYDKNISAATSGRWIKVVPRKTYPKAAK